MRFSLIIGGAESREYDGELLISSIANNMGDHRRIDLNGATILVSCDSHVERIGRDSVIIGQRHLHQNGVQSGGEGSTSNGGENVFGMLASRWGDFFLISSCSTGGGNQIARSPMASTSCYYMKVGRYLIVTTHVGDVLRGFPGNCSIDWEQVARHLMFSQLRSSMTCLAGVSELLCGHILSGPADRPNCYSFWSPWTSCRKNAQIIDYRDAVAAVREAVQFSVSARAKEFSNILLTISGGLDSSIVASALKKSEAKFSCLTMYTQDKSGDERDYARMVADHLGARLIERPERLEDVSLGLSGAADLPRPVSRLFSQSSDAAQMRASAQIGADAFFTGGGGDSVFCYLSSVSPVADRLRSGGNWRAAVGTARDIASITGAGIPEVIFKGVQRAWLRSPAYRWPKVTALLNQSARRLDPILHPWLEAPEDALPGKAGHIASLVAIQNDLEGYVRARIAPVVHPLLSLPIVETCLQVPSWMWCANGHNRAVARDAFADTLPTVISRRLSKGTPGGFVAKIYDERRLAIREMLLEGLVVASGIIDRPALEKLLAAPPTVANYDYLRVMLIVDAEAWARSWLSLRTARAYCGTS